jgi:ribonuclease HII
MDEVGRGCLAGPVIAAAVILKEGSRLPGVNDSKLVPAGRREQLMREILRSAAAWAIGAADASEIDRVNILNATRLAMKRAVEALPIEPDHLLIDAVRLPDVPIAQTPLIRGDRISMSIAAASIAAKVVRDRVMEFYDRIYPGFGFASHKGYGTAEHLRAVGERGACPIHRLTFRGVWRQGDLALPAAHDFS